MDRDTTSRDARSLAVGASFHESLSLAVQEIASFTSRSLCDETASSIDSCRMKLNKLEIFIGKTCSGHHCCSITSAGMGRGAREVCTAISSSSKDCVFGSDSVKGSIFKAEGKNTQAPSFVHQKIHCKVLDEIVTIISERLAIQCVKQRMSSTISNSTASMGLTTFAKV